MKYAVISTWKHTNPIDWDNVKPPVDATPEGTTVQWFAIDEHNHGSFVTQPSQEVCEDFKAKLEAWRKEEVVTLDIEKTMEAVSPIHVAVENQQVLITTTISVATEKVRTRNLIKWFTSS